MPKYRYAGEVTRVYPQLVIPGQGSLVANPGDEYEGDAPPDSYWWFEVDNKVSPPAPASLNVITTSPAAPVTGE